MLNALRALFEDRKGATAIEYGLICGMVVVAIVAAISMLADTTTDMWDNVADKVEAVS